MWRRMREECARAAHHSNNYGNFGEPYLNLWFVVVFLFLAVDQRRRLNRMTNHMMSDERWHWACCTSFTIDRRLNQQSAIQQTSQFSREDSRAQVSRKREQNKIGPKLISDENKTRSTFTTICNRTSEWQKGSDRDISKLVPEIIRALRNEQERRRQQERRNTEKRPRKVMRRRRFHIYKLVISNAARVVPPGFDTSLCPRPSRPPLVHHHHHHWVSVWSISVPNNEDDDGVTLFSFNSQKSLLFWLKTETKEEEYGGEYMKYYTTWNMWSSRVAMRERWERIKTEVLLFDVIQFFFH